MSTACPMDRDMRCAARVCAVLARDTRDRHSCPLHALFWVAGTRMIDQGTDGLSRGGLLNGAMAGDSMLRFVPLNRGVEEREGGLVRFFINSSCGIVKWTHLNSDGWYGQAFQVVNYIWTPPPAAALAALEQMCEVKHIRPEGAHICVCPALMTYEWRKRLRRVADVCVYYTGWVQLVG